MIQLRRMGFNDIEEVLDIEKTLCDFPWTYTIFSDCLRAEYSAWILVDSALKELIIGYGLVSIGAGEGHILNLCIHPQRQRQGLGTYLLKHLLNEARNENALSVFLEARLSNTGAFQLYQKLGFTVIGKRKGYYEHANGREDAMVLEFVFP